MALTFLTNDDLLTEIFEDYLDESVQEDVEALAKIELAQIAYMKSKLRSRYDVSKIFLNSENYEDKPVIKQILTALVNYFVVKRNAARKIPTDFNESYKMAIKWLNDVRDGVENPQLPAYDVQKNLVQWGNNKNKDLYY